MTRNTENHKKTVHRAYNTRQHSRQTNFATNRPHDFVGEPQRTPKLRNKPRGLKSKKDFTVEPLSSRRLFLVENNMPGSDPLRSPQDTGAGDAFFGFPVPSSETQNLNISGSRRSTATLANNSTTTTTSSTSTNPMSTGTIHRSVPHHQSQTNQNIPPGNLNRDTYSLWRAPGTANLTPDMVQRMITRSQEEMMNVMIGKFNELLKTHTEQQSAAANPQYNHNYRNNRWNQGNWHNNRQNINRYQYQNNSIRK